ncbi:MAG: ribose 5-phosphate isomerase A [Sulfolobales archaeon]
MITLDVERARQLVVREALKYLVDAEIIGIGTGSTVDMLINLMSASKDVLRSKYFIASSTATALKLRDVGFKVFNTLSVDYVDIYVDSADRVDRNLNLIKGGGAALTLEKLLAYYSKFNLFIIDYSKFVDRFSGDELIPIDVLPQALSLVTNQLRKLGYKYSIRYSGKGKYGPVVSDVGGIIVDVNLPVGEDLSEFNRKIKYLPGVIETGLFIGFSDLVLVGYADRVDALRGCRLTGM